MAANPIKVRMVSASRRGRFGMEVLCAEHRDFYWTLDAPSRRPMAWHEALLVAYGHACMEHPRLRLTIPTHVAAQDWSLPEVRRWAE